MDITDIVKQARAGTLKRKKAKAASWQKGENTGITIGCMLEIAIADTPKEIRSKLQTLAKKQRKVKLELDVERYSQDVFVLRLPASKPIKEQQLTLIDK